MSRTVAVVVVCAVLAIMGGAVAAGTTATSHTAASHATHASHTSNLPPVVSGKVVKVTAVSGALQSFVLDRGSTYSAKHRRVTINVSADTTYVLLKAAGTSTDVKAGAKVLVRLSAALKDLKGDAVSVRVRTAAPVGTTATTHTTAHHKAY